MEETERTCVEVYVVELYAQGYVQPRGSFVDGVRIPGGRCREEREGTKAGARLLFLRADHWSWPDDESSRGACAMGSAKRRAWWKGEAIDANVGFAIDGWTGADVITTVGVNVDAT